MLPVDICANGGCGKGTSIWMNTTNGKMAEQSKEKLAQAMLAIMEQYDYREITITQISQEACLSRKTFYRLFKGKEELLDFYFGKLFQEYQTQIEARRPERYWNVVQCYFDFCEERKELLFLLRRNNLLGAFFEASYQYSFAVFSYVRSAETADRYARFLPYLLAYSVGGMYSMALKWVESGMDIPSAVLIEKLKSGFLSPDF